MLIGVPKETFRNERRVALVPAAVGPLVKQKHEVLLEKGAGESAGYNDSQYQEAGAKLFGRDEVFARSDLLLQVRTFGANPEAGAADLPRLRREQVVIGFMDPLGSPQHAKKLAASGVSAFAMELVPRITRAQAMDALSSMAMLAGYKAVLLAANTVAKMFPMMMTAAGSITPARVFVMGAGVAGLQAIATAKRLGAVVEAYDVRPEVKDQVTSVGGKFVELPLAAADATDKGGYARAQSEEFYAKQRQLLGKHVQAADVVITTAAVPGRKAPVLVTADMVRGMRRGSLVVDLAAETGGNCELTRLDEMVDVSGVLVLGPSNVPSSLAFHASQLYAKNLTSFLALLVVDGKLTINTADEIISGSLVTQGGRIVHDRVREAAGS